MGISIGNNNTLQGNINIGDNAKQIAENFNQEFNSIDRILNLLKQDIIKNYNKDDKEVVLKTYDELMVEISKPEEKRDTTFIKNSLKTLHKVFSFIADSSSIAGLIVALIQVL